MKKALLILFTFHLSLFTSSAQSLTDSLRTDALRWASRGYFNKSLDYLRQMPVDSISIAILTMHC